MSVGLIRGGGEGLNNPFVTTDLNTLLTALYVKIDDWLGRPRRSGRPPRLSDAELLTLAGWSGIERPGDQLADRLQMFAVAGGLPARLRDMGIPQDDLPGLAAAAATQWTGTFNPQPFDAEAALALYQRAF